MEIVSLNSDLEATFWEHVNQDLPHYYFFAHDWKYNRSDTEILLALKESHIDGMMLVFNQKIVQLRGSRESAKALLERLDLQNVELQALKEHRQHVLERYKPTWSHELTLMVLHKGGEKLHITHRIVSLDTTDADQLSAIMKTVDPEFWGDVTSEQIAEGMSNTFWVGIKVNKELVSIGRARITEMIGHIPTVATLEPFRCRGYATSITSELVKLILGKMPIAIIYVLSDNPPAIRVYRKIGFKPYRKYFFIRGERR